MHRYAGRQSDTNEHRLRANETRRDKENKVVVRDVTVMREDV